MPFVSLSRGLETSTESHSLAESGHDRIALLIDREAFQSTPFMRLLPSIIPCQPLSELQSSVSHAESVHRRHLSKIGVHLTRYPISRPLICSSLLTTNMAYNLQFSAVIMLLSCLMHHGSKWLTTRAEPACQALLFARLALAPA